MDARPPLSPLFLPERLEVGLLLDKGQVPGRLTESRAVAMDPQMPFDAQGSRLGNTSSLQRPICAQGVAASPHVGSIPTFTSTVVDALAHSGVTQMTLPHSAHRVWQQRVTSGVVL